jgi:hypothetical protein
MTKQINDWKTRLILWLEKRREKEKQREIKNFKESVLLTLGKSLTTEESIKVFNEIVLEYKQLMFNRLEKVSKEKSVLEFFLSADTKTIKRNV